MKRRKHDFRSNKNTGFTSSNADRLIKVASSALNGLLPSVLSFSQATKTPFHFAGRSRLPSGGVSDIVHALSVGCKMRIEGLAFAMGIALLPASAGAQCFNRAVCDSSVMEIRSQMSVSVPVPGQASASDGMKAMEDARRDLYNMANRECDMFKSIYGGECTLTQVNMNSSIQDRGSNTKAAYVSVSNTYQIKRTAK